jgi:O-antigen ligase
LLDIAALSSVVQKDLSAEDGSNIRRLCGTGIFNDPNDYALMLVLCMCVCVYGAGRARWWGWRGLAWGAFVFLGYALVLTHSRGGVLSVMAAAGTFVAARVGWRNAVPLAAPLGAVILAAFWGRQTELNLSDPNDTFQGRMDLWSASMDVFRAHPILGIGQGKLVDEIGQVTHNSFLHAFAEMGLVGGTVFIGAFYLAFRGLWAARPVDGELSRLRPCVLAILVGYSVGMLALSRCYTAPVQLVLGLAGAYLVMASEPGRPLIPRLDLRCLVRVWSVGVVFLGATYVFIRVMKNHGG